MKAFGNRSIDKVHVCGFPLSLAPFFFFERQCLAAPFSKRERKKNHRQVSRTPEQPRNNKSVCVCATQRKRVHVVKEQLPLHRAIRRNGAENMFGKKWGKDQFHKESWRSENLCSVDMHPHSLCGQLRHRPPLTDTNRPTCLSTVAWGRGSARKRAEAATAGSWVWAPWVRVAEAMALPQTTKQIRVSCREWKKPRLGSHTAVVYSYFNAPYWGVLDTQEAITVRCMHLDALGGKCISLKPLPQSTP